MLNSSRPMPVPSAVISVPICSERQHPVEARPLDVEDLAAQRQHRLDTRGRGPAWRSRRPSRPRRGRARTWPGRAPGSRRACRGGGDVERGLAARQLARLARRLAGRGGLGDLADDDLGLGRMLLEPGAELLVDDVLDHRPDFGGDQLVLGLRREFRIRHLDREHAGQALAAVVAGERDLLPLEDARALGIAGHLARQRAAEAGEMRAAVALRDVVGEAEHVLVVAVVPPHRRLRR